MACHAFLTHPRPFPANAPMLGIFNMEGCLSICVGLLGCRNNGVNGRVVIVKSERSERRGDPIQSNNVYNSFRRNYSAIEFDHWDHRAQDYFNSTIQQMSAAYWAPFHTLVGKGRGWVLIMYL